MRKLSGRTCLEKYVAAAGCLSWRPPAAASLRLPPLGASVYRAGTSRGPAAATATAAASAAVAAAAARRSSTAAAAEHSSSARVARRAASQQRRPRRRSAALAAEQERAAAAARQVLSWTPTIAWRAQTCSLASARRVRRCGCVQRGRCGGGGAAGALPTPVVLTWTPTTAPAAPRRSRRARRRNTLATCSRVREARAAVPGCVQARAVLVSACGVRDGLVVVRVASHGLAKAAG